VRPEVALDLRHYRIAAEQHSQPFMRACAACKLAAWRGHNPTEALVARLADVEPSVAAEVVKEWHGGGRVRVGATAIEAAADLTPMAGGPFHPQRRRRRHRR
jgi:hypothetical protein